MQALVADHEQRIRALEERLNALTTGDLVLDASGKRLRPDDAPPPVQPNTWAFYFIGAVSAEEEAMAKKTIRLLLRGLPQYWKEITSPREAAMIFYITFVRDGKLEDVSSVDRFAIRGQQSTVGVVFRPPEPVMGWPHWIVSTNGELNYVLGQDNSIAEQKFREWMRYRMDIFMQQSIQARYTCSVCGKGMEKRKVCGLGCKTLYCSQECAVKHWEQGHWEDHEEEEN